MPKDEKTALSSTLQRFSSFWQPSDMQNIFYLTILKIMINPSTYIAI